MVGLVVLAVGCMILKFLDPFADAHEPSNRLMQFLLPRLQRLVGSWSLAAMVLYPLGVLTIFMLERLYPAVPDQKTLSNGVVHDALWVLISAAVGVVMFGWYLRLLYSVYDRHLSFLTLSMAASLPVLVRLAIGAVILDLTRWVQHWLHHRVKWLWPFHAVHHSQRELNLFSDYKIHFMEYFVRLPVSLFPMLMLGLSQPQVLWWLLLLAWHSRLYHANIRSDFGPLRYLLVTPQSHRLHHSRDPRHFDHNYGAMLSVWDYLFGTQYRRYDVYPETGIPDEKFPAERSASLSDVLMTPVRQMVYPFRQLRTSWQADHPRAVTPEDRTHV